ncbi:hypothetical protein BD770DRAFT_403768, partial [Pilaira anomala]
KKIDLYLLPVLASNITIFPALVCKIYFESFHALAAILIFRSSMVIWDLQWFYIKVFQGFVNFFF